MLMISSRITYFLFFKITFLVFCIWPFFLFAQNTISITKLDESPLFDGIPDEDIWKKTNPFPMIMQSPVYGKNPAEITDARMFFTDDYLYVGVKLLYSNTEEMRPFGKKRDYFSASCDWFCLMLDTFNDKENGMIFSTNPNGLRWDATVSNDGTMGFMDINVNWNTFWDVECKIDEHGWYTEMRIPVSSLRFQSINNTVNMGMTMMRYLPGKNETFVFPDIEPNWDMAFWKPSEAADIEFVGLQSESPIYIAPYLLAGFERENTLNNEETAYNLSKTPDLEAGLDLKYGLTSNLTLDLTLNTDFAQVEADDQMINLTRFSLFFPEKRPFFLEKSDVFSFDLLGGNNLFYSRRVGLNEEEPVRIYGGARITGRAGKWDVGFLDMMTAKSSNLPSENFGVFRTKRNIINQNSYAGGMLTSRLGIDGTYNINYGLDAVIRMFGDDYLTMRWAQTFEDTLENNAFSKDPSRLLVQWNRRRIEGFSYDVLFTWSGPEFNPGIGFEVFDNYYAEGATFKYGWLPDENKSGLRAHNFQTYFYAFHSSLDHSLLSLQSSSMWMFESRSGYFGFTSFNWNQEEITDSLDFDQAVVPPGSYKFSYAVLSINTPSGFRIREESNVEFGQFYDGIRFSFMITPYLNIGSDLELSGTYRLDYVDFKDRGQHFTNHIFRIKTLYTISTKVTLSSLVQYNTAIDGFIINARFRYNPREGNDFYIVYNEDLNSNIYREIPTLPYSNYRTFMLKYTYTFGF